MPLSNLYLFYYNRKLKLKIDWNKLRELCSIKRSTYDKLVAEMEIHVVKLLGKQLNILILPIQNLSFSLSALGCVINPMLPVNFIYSTQTE